MIQGALQHFLQEIDSIQAWSFFGHVTGIRGPIIEVRGLSDHATSGSSCVIEDRHGNKTRSEVIGFHKDITLLMAYERLEGLGPGCCVYLSHHQACVYPSKGWLGRVVNGLGAPVDHKGPLPYGSHEYDLYGSPLSAHDRRLLEYRLDVGVRAINSFLTLCKGQRMGIFAGSGVGKSVLLSQLAKFTESRVVVIGLIGERGREVREFLEKHLGPEGMAKAVVVVATSDEPALMRRRAAYLTLALAEYFRDQGQDVLCLMDSVTRFAMALREIGLALGEMPASRGYTPSVFAELPKLLERAGPGLEKNSACGDITGIFTVLVDGDDHNEPVADTVRGILDGHIVLDREIAERGRFPAIHILKSVSRTLPDCQSIPERLVIQRARQLLSTYENMADMIRLGAYRKGSSPEVDEAIHFYPLLNAFLHQNKEESTSMNEGFHKLADLLQMSDVFENA